MNNLGRMAVRFYLPFYLSLKIGFLDNSPQDAAWAKAL
jgi:hypothetical protein